MLLFFLFIIGLSLGSFLNVLIDRLPKKESITGRSYCDHCKKKIESYDLIPVFSYFYLGGKCRFCGKKINPSYPFVELLTGTLFVLAFLYAPVDSLTLKILYLGVVSSLIVIFFSDFKYQIIPDRIQILFGLFVLAVLFYQGLTFGDFVLRLLRGFLIASPLAFLFLYTSGKGMGFADIKFAFIMGVFLGARAGFIGLYLAFVTGSLWGLYLIAFKKKTFKSRVAFGPFLVIGTVLSALFYNQIFDFISRLLT